MNHKSQQVICLFLMGSIIIEMRYLLADQPHTHVEQPDQPFFVSTLQPSATTTLTGAGPIFRDWQKPT